MGPEKRVVRLEEQPEVKLQHLLQFWFLKAPVLPKKFRHSWGDYLLVPRRD